MPELNEIISKETKEDQSTSIINATVIDQPVDKPKPKKKDTIKPATKITKPKKEAHDENISETEIPTEIPKEPKLRRPPLEMITKDISSYITEKKINNIPIKQLEYKCGKIIFGIPNENEKDFRVIAFKARKKSKTVAGKSRCIYYFGITKDHKTITKTITGTSTTNFGKCSVQSQKPIQLVLDKSTFNEFFEQNEDKVTNILKKLVDLTISHKEDQYAELQEKKASKQKTQNKNTKKKKEVSGDK